MAKITEVKKKVDETQVSQEPSQDLNAILQQMKALQEEVTVLKEGKKNMFVKGKEKNKEAKRYSYKLRGGIPVLSYKSVPKDATKDYVYKNEKGQYLSNHILELRLANDKTVKVDVVEFGKSFTRSEKLVAKEVIDEGIVVGYEFKDTDYGDIVVLPNVIN